MFNDIAESRIGEPRFQVEHGHSVRPSPPPPFTKRSMEGPFLTELRQQSKD